MDWMPHRVRYVEDMKMFEETGIHECPDLTDGRVYDVEGVFEYSDGEAGCLIFDDNHCEGSAKPYRLELFVPILYACPCCGRKTLTIRGNYEVCETCYWEDEPRQEENPDNESSANDNLSLTQYRAKWIDDKKSGVYDCYSFDRARSYNHYHRADLENDNVCGCYYCETIFSPTEIEEWCCESPRDEGVTAICPHCGIDSVIGESSGYQITPELLKSMHKYF